MAHRPRAKARVWILVVAGAMIVVWVISLLVPPQDMTAVVQDVEADGLIALEVDGRTARVHLGLVELAGSDELCRGKEGVEHLRRLLPTGTTVTLIDGLEHHGRGAYVTALLVDDLLVDAQLAESGLAVPTDSTDHPELMKQVRAGHSEAEEAQVGYFDPSITCAPAGLLDLYESQVQEFTEASVAATSSGDIDVIRSALRAHSAVADTHARVQRMLWDDAQALPAAVLDVTAMNELRERANAGVAAANAALAEAETALRAAEEAAAEAARQAEVARQAEAARQAEVARQAEADRQAAAQRKRSAAPPKSSSSTGSGGYTGCRAYAPGGKTWTPIPCP